VKHVVASKETIPLAPAALNSLVPRLVDTAIRLGNVAVDLAFPRIALQKFRVPSLDAPSATMTSREPKSCAAMLSRQRCSVAAPFFTPMMTLIWGDAPGARRGRNFIRVPMVSIYAGPARVGLFIA